MITCNVENEENVNAQVKEQMTEIVTSDYKKLQHLPTLNGEPIIGNVEEKDPTVPIWAKEKTKPSYNANEVNAVPQDSVISFAEIDEMFDQVFNS